MNIPQRNESPLGFVYVPKTGGTYLSISVIPSEYGYDLSSSPSKIHMTTSMVESIIDEGEPLFTIVRDPYNRVCSEYHFLKNKSQEYFSWDLSDTNKLKSVGYFSSKMKNHQAFFNKIYAIYLHNMTVEDYIEWSIDNPTYQVYYDTRTPKDFEVVGVTEKMSETVELLKNMHEVLSGSGSFNENKKKAINNPYKTKYSKKEFKKKASIEYDLYNEGLDRFNTLSEKWL